jgi:hypothetical protein
MNRQQALKILEEIPWHRVTIPAFKHHDYKTIALSEEQIEAVAFMLSEMRYTPDPEANSVDSPLARYDNGAYTQDNG